MLPQLVARRVAQALLTFVGATIVLFALVTLLPGDEIRALFGFSRPDPDVLRLLHDTYHLDDPFPIRYARYMAGALRGDLGPLYTQAPLGGLADHGAVNAIVAATAPATIRALTVSLVVQMVVGVPTALWLARRRSDWTALAALIALAVAVAVPIFLTASLVRLGSVKWLGAVVLEGRGWVQAILPGVVSALIPTALLIGIGRQQAVSGLTEPWAKAMRGLGIPDRRVVRPYAAREVMIAGVTLVAGEIGATLTSLLVVEDVLNVNGLGRTILAAVRTQQGPLVMGGVLTFIAIGVVATLAADLVRLALDPRQAI